MTLKNQMDEFISFANVLADESTKIIMEYFRQTLTIENKDDDTPVTIADKKSELKIRELINKAYPSHGILAEEFDDTNLDSEYIWVIDPIDGTRSFIAGHKDFGTLIALLYKKKPVLGIINCPAHSERWIGIENQITTLNGKKIKTSQKKSIEDCYTITTGLYLEDEIFRNAFENIIKKSKDYILRGDCYMYGMLSSGLVDIVFEDTLKAHDYMALVPVIQGAGGVISDKFNNPITLDSDGSVLATANSLIHKQAINMINL